MAMATFIRGYARVLDATEASDDEVVLERRAGRPTFVLATLRRVHADRHAVAAVAHVLRHALGTEEGGKVIAAGLVEEFPWSVFLSAAERDRFTTEILDVLRACAALGRFTAFADLVDSWQASAQVWSDPGLARRLLAPVEAPPGGEVPAPASLDA